MTLRTKLAVYFVANLCREMSLDHLLHITESAILGGVRSVQLRYKGATTAEMVAVGRCFRELTRVHGAFFFVNDDIVAAQALGADGAHVGQGDARLTDVRAFLGSNALIGVSAQTPDQVREAIIDGADYIGLGPIYSTRSKMDAVDPIGEDGILPCVAVRNGSDVPIIGIGGIRDARAQAVVRAGLDGVAVISAIAKNPNPQDAAARLVAAVKSVVEDHA